jgi:hypothetical protein
MDDDNDKNKNYNHMFLDQELSPFSVKKWWISTQMGPNGKAVLNLWPRLIKIT